MVSWAKTYRETWPRDTGQVFVALQAQWPSTVGTGHVYIIAVDACQTVLSAVQNHKSDWYCEADVVCRACVLASSAAFRFAWRNTIMGNSQQFIRRDTATVPKHSATGFSECRMVCIKSVDPQRSDISSTTTTTLGGSWSVQQFYSTVVYPLPSPSNQ
jgi:hypothetical protein